MSTDAEHPDSQHDSDTAAADEAPAADGGAGDGAATSADVAPDAAAADASSPPAAASHGGRGMSVLRWTLIVLSVALATVGALAGWVRTQLLDTETWEQTSRATIQEPAVQTALTEYVSNELNAAIEPEALVAEALPPELDPLAAPAGAVVRVGVNDAVERVVASPFVEDLWVGANTLGHEQFIALIEGEQPIIVESAAGIALDLRPVLEAVGERLGLSPELVERIGQRVDPIVVPESQDTQRTLQTIRVFRDWSPLIGIAAVALLGIALWLGPGSRRTLLQGWGVGIVAGGLLLLVARPWLGDTVASAISEVSTWQAAMLATWEQLSVDLELAGRLLVWIGALVVLAAWFGGPGAVATRARSLAAVPMSGHRTPIRIGAALLWLLALATVPTLARLEPLSALVLTLLAVAGWIALEAEISRGASDATGDGSDGRIAEG